MGLDQTGNQDKAQKGWQGGFTSIAMAYRSLSECEDITIVQQAATVLYRYFITLSSAEILRLGKQMQALREGNWGYDWRIARPEQNCGFLTEDEYFVKLAMGTFHPNGYYREKCLQLIAKYSGRALPYFLLRVNDWVPQISNAAYDFASETLRVCPFPQVIAAMPYLYFLGRGGRKKPQAYGRLVHIAEQRFIMEREQLAQMKFYALERYAKRMCYQILIHCDCIPTPQWKEILCSERDDFSCLFLVRNMLEKQERLEEWLPIFLEHRHRQVRLSALQKILQREGAAWPGFQRYLTDTSFSIRALAQFAVKKSGRMEEASLAAFYRRMIRENTSDGAILGLSEVGREEDCEDIRLLLNADKQRIAIAAFVALYRLRGMKETETLYQALLEKKGKVSKIIFELLRKETCQYSCEKMYQDLCATEDVVLKRRLCKLIARGERWDKLPWLLLLYQDADQTIAWTAANACQRWTMGFTHPTLQQKNRIIEALEKQKRVMPASLYQSFVFCLKHV